MSVAGVSQVSKYWEEVSSVLSPKLDIYAIPFQGPGNVTGKGVEECKRQRVERVLWDTGAATTEVNSQQPWPPEHQQQGWGWGWGSWEEGNRRLGEGLEGAKVSVITTQSVHILSYQK